jgi:Mor family transcriptional regulator
MTKQFDNEEDITVMLTHEITEVVRQITKLSEVEAMNVAMKAVTRVQERFGGHYRYIKASDKDERNIGILKEFTGTTESLRYVMNKYGVTKSTVYRVCRRKRYLLKKNN